MWDVIRSLSATARELRALSTDRPTDFCAPGVLRTLYSLLTVDSPVVATDAAGAIADLCNHEASRKAIRESGGLAQIVTQLSRRDGTLSLAMEAARALGNMAGRGGADDPTIQDEIRNAGAIAPLVELLLENPRSVAAVQTALALRNLAYEHPHNQDAIREAGGIRALVALLSSESAASPEAAHALRNLARNNVANKEALCKAGGVAPLLAMLRTDSTVQNANAAMVLCNLVNRGGTQPGTAAPPAGAGGSQQSAEMVELDALLEMDTDRPLPCAPCEPAHEDISGISGATSPTMRGSTSPPQDLNDTSLLSLSAADNLTPSRAPVLTSCWAVLLRGSEEGCDLSFRVVGSHLQEKFCSRCRSNGVLVPRNKVRALPPALCSVVTNGKSEGFWTDGAPLQLGSGGYRLINHTQGCEGPRLVVLESARDAALESGINWPMLPAAWVESGENIRLWISRGTLVPRKPRKSFCPSVEGGFSGSSSKRQRVVNSNKNEQQRAMAYPDARQPQLTNEQSLAAAQYHQSLLTSRPMEPVPRPPYEPTFDVAAYGQQPGHFVPAMRPEAYATAATYAMPAPMPNPGDPAYQNGVFRPRLIPALGPYGLA